jgi:hypothetical protein
VPACNQPERPGIRHVGPALAARATVTRTTARPGLRARYGVHDRDAGRAWRAKLTYWKAAHPCADHDGTCAASRNSRKVVRERPVASLAWLWTLRLPAKEQIGHPDPRHKISYQECCPIDCRTREKAPTIRVSRFIEEEAINPAGHQPWEKKRK